MILTFSFLLIAIIYSMVGFGGGSSYLAILSLTNIVASEIVIIALIANIVVVGASSANFFFKGHYHPKLALPLCLASIPLAFIKIKQSKFVKFRKGQK